MATELSDENRVLLLKCIAKVLGRKVEEINPSDLIEILPDPGQAVSTIKADEVAGREYIARAIRAAGWGP